MLRRAGKFPPDGDQITDTGLFDRPHVRRQCLSDSAENETIGRADIRQFRSALVGKYKSVDQATGTEQDRAAAAGAAQDGHCIGATGGLIHIFGDPAATYALFRPPILGVDTTGGGAGVLRGFPSWSLDGTLSKEIRASERFGATLIIQVTNVLNHFQPENPTLNINSPQTWGVVTDQSTVGSLSGIGGTARGVPTINPRQMEFGLRLHF